MLAFATALLSLLWLNAATSSFALPGDADHKNAPHTNAERMARGMSPLRPRRLFNSTATYAARAAIPSDQPGTPVTGGVGLYSTTNGKRSNFLGYIGITGALYQDFGWQTTFQYNRPSDPNAVVSVKAQQYKNTYWTFVPIVSGRMVASNTGGVITFYDYDVTPEGTNYIKFYGVQTDSSVSYRDVPAGTPAGYIGGIGAWSELDTFRVNPATGVVSVVWRNHYAANPDLVFCIVDNQVRATANPTKLAAAVAPSTVTNCGLQFMFDAGGVKSG